MNPLRLLAQIGQFHGRLVTGHDFSRAENGETTARAFAPEEFRRVPHPFRVLCGVGGRPSPSAAAFLLLLTLLAAPLAPAQPTRADAEKDPVLAAMLQELDRSMSQLQLPGFQKPFFIQYRVVDVEDFETKAAFGAGEGTQHNRARIARVTVRVGDYKTDSSGGRGDGALEITALDNDPVALRSALWTATDQAYKNALASYAQKQAALKQVQTPPQADDFSRQTPIVALATPLTLVLDSSAWEQRVAHDSGLYRTDPSVNSTRNDVQYSMATFHARVATTRLVNSEGAIVRKSAANYQESLGVGAQAADGMRLDRSFATTGATLKDIDTAQAFQQHATALIASLSDLRKAPLVEEEYHGPVLLSSDASADTLLTLVAGSVTATRPPLGTAARTNGPFANSYHARVLPEFLNIEDDPGLKSFDGKSLVGAYEIDDEGVAAQAVQLVTNGQLENYLVAREPIRDFPTSNGHGRAGVTSPPHPSIGVMKVTANPASAGLSDEALQRKLLDLAKDHGLKSVYYAATLGPGLTPRLLYRISQDGTRELVRGAMLDDLDQRALRSGIVAAGKDLWVANYAGDVPQTVLAPALLLDDVTIRRANEKNDKLPYYPPPD
ncbi:MAG TPA: metallopeptidase TldD-related protein [Terracidiphilus sp.]|jgi:predicted Zn-dependent protease|nr:metallopeptidase TldD-related protein [Terracidiphilus sp.]